MTRMALRKLILAGLLGGAAYMPMSAQAQAIKAPDVHFYPTKQWSIVRDNQYCAINNRFNNGFLIGFSGTSRWVDGLNVNFRQSVFEKGKSYAAKVTVPGGETVSFQAKAVNEEAVTLNFRNKKDLYEKIRTSGVLDLTIEGNAFRFYLTGFAANAKGFEQCMGGGVKQPAKAAPEAPEIASVKKEVVTPEAVTPPAATIEAETLTAPATPLMASSRDLAKPDFAGATTNETIALEEQIKNDAIQPRKRMLDALSEEIQKNPDLIAMDANQNSPRKKELAMPPGIEKLKPVAEKTAKDEPALPMPPKAEEASIAAAAPMPDETALEPAPAPKPSPQMVAEKAAAPEATPERIQWNQNPATPAAKVEAEEVAALTPPAPQEIEEVAISETAPALEPAPEPVREKVSMKTPQMKVTKETAHIEADFTHIEPASAASDDARLDAMHAKMSVLQSKMDALKAENRALNDDLERALQASEKERMTIASENWNLESATMKFNEAERQIQRLGKQLQTERAKCNVEKKELEAMLFDPQLTQENQLARLASLEEQLAQAKQEMAAQRMRYEEKIRILQTTASTR